VFEDMIVVGKKYNRCQLWPTRALSDDPFVFAMMDRFEDSTIVLADDEDRGDQIGYGESNICDEEFFHTRRL